MLASGSVPVNGVILTLLVLVTSIALVAGLAWASRRLVGLPVGALRALIAGLLGFAAAEILVRTLQPVQSGHVAAFLTVVLGVPLIVAMIFIVAAEALVPSGTVPQPVDAVLGARRALARSRRYSQISRIAVRHGLGPYLRGRGRRAGDEAGGRAALARSLRQALEEGGVTFVKLGQLMSTRRDLLPRRFDRVTGAIEQGRLSLNVRLSADGRDRRVVTGLTHQFLLAFLGATSAIVAAILLGTAGGPEITPTLSLLQLIGYNLLIVGGILARRVLYVIFWSR
jgi:hypothetical protein